MMRDRVDAGLVRELYRVVLRIRGVEERIRDLYAAGQSATTTPSSSSSSGASTA